MLLEGGALTVISAHQ